MPQSLVKILVHIVFSTKDRVDLITHEMEAELFKYITGIVKGNGGRLIIVNETANHIHLLISIGRVDIGDLIGHIKRDSSLWIKKKYPRKISSTGNGVTLRFRSDNLRFWRFLNIFVIRKRII